MKTIKKWNTFNESIDKNEILSEIVDMIGQENLSDLYFGNSINPYVYFIFNDKPFSVSLTDKIGMSGEYSTITVVVEENGISKSLGYFKPNETIKVVDCISNY
jgi:hypothetical protein